MLGLSQTAGYAIRALCCLERASGRRLLARQIAAQTGIPKPYLSKILHALGRSGLISTKRGYHGGFMLSRPAERISLLDIVEATEGRNWQQRCLLGLEECSDERSCPTHAFWKIERGRIERELRRLSLAVVAQFERRSGGRAGVGGTTRSRRSRSGADWLKNPTDWDRRARR